MKKNNRNNFSLMLLGISLCCSSVSYAHEDINQAIVLAEDKIQTLGVQQQPKHQDFTQVKIQTRTPNSQFAFDLNLPTDLDIKLRDLDLQDMQPKALSDNSKIANRSANRANSVYAGCDDMSFGQFINTGFTQAGEIICRGIQVTQKTKIEALLMDIPTAANFDLYLFQVVNGQLTLKAHSSAGVGQTFERIVTMADPGVYVLAAKAQTYAAGGPTPMTLFGYTEFDQQESNDTYTQATQITGITTVTGTMDHARDMDYFVYNFGNEQKNISFKFIANEKFILEVYTEKGWSRTKINKDYVIAPFPTTSNESIFRVVSAKTTPLSSSTYQISFSEPRFVNAITVNVEEDMQGFRFPVTYTQIRNNLTIKGKTLDQYGHPLPFAPVFLKYLIGSEAKIERVESNHKGEYETSARLPDCSGTILQTIISNYAAGYTYFYDFDYSFQSTDVIAYSPTAKEYKRAWYSQLCYVNMTGSCYHYRDVIKQKWINTCTNN